MNVKIFAQILQVLLLGALGLSLSLGVLTKPAKGVTHIPTTFSAIATINPVDYFAFGPVDNRLAGDPFPITITARDVFSNVVSTYSGSVILSDTTGTINPTSIGAFVNGMATVTIVIGIPANNVVITATDGLTIGVSNVFHIGTTTPSLNNIFLPVIFRNSN
jgi:hypothetical protein